MSTGFRTSRAWPLSDYRPWAGEATRGTSLGAGSRWVAVYLCARGCSAGRNRGHEIMMRPRGVIKSHGGIDLLRFLSEPRAHGATPSYLMQALPGLAPWALLGPQHLTCGQETPRAAAGQACEAVQNRQPGPGVSQLLGSALKGRSWRVC